MSLESTAQTFNNLIPAWITPLFIVVVFAILLYLKIKRTGGNLTRNNMLAILAVSSSGCFSFFMFLNLCYEWTFDTPSFGYPFKLPSDTLIVAFFFLVLFVDTLNRSIKKHSVDLKRIKKKRSRHTKASIL